MVKAFTPSRGVELPLPIREKSNLSEEWQSVGLLVKRFKKLLASVTYPEFCVVSTVIGLLSLSVITFTEQSAKAVRVTILSAVVPSFFKVART